MSGKVKKARARRMNINGADIFIVIVTLICILAIVARISVMKSDKPLFSNEERELGFYAYCDEEAISHIKAGDMLRTSEGREFGTLKEGFSASEHDEGYIITGVIVTEGRDVFGAWFVSGVRTVSSGDSLTLDGDGYTLEATFGDVSGT